MTPSDPSLPTFALDFETTGLDPAMDQVVEVGLAGPRSFQALVSDAPASGPEAQEVHRIGAAELRQSGIPGVRALEGLLDAMGEGPLRIAAHHASFEQAFLEAWARRLGRRLPSIEWVCTHAWARRLCPDPTVSASLGALAWRLGLRHGSLHRAPEDAALTHRLANALQTWETLRNGLDSGAQLIYLAGPLRGDGSRGAIRRNVHQMRLLATWAQGVLSETTLFVPHLAFAFLDEARDRSGLVRERALLGCERTLARCDALVLCGETLSPGMAREREVAQAEGIPTFQVPGWDASRTALRPEDDAVA